MAKHAEPKDYMLGRTAYQTYFDEPHVRFEDLSHDYQMRWVTIARTVIIENKRLTTRQTNGVVNVDNGEHGSSQGNLTDEQLVASAPRKNGGTSKRIDYAAMPIAARRHVREAMIRLAKKRYRDKKRIEAAN